MRVSRVGTLMAIGFSLGACAQGEWVVETWGEDFIEEGIPSAAFDDGCEARFDSFLVVIAQADLINGDGQPVGGSDGALIFDVAEPGPHALGAWSVPRGPYDEARFVIAPASAPEQGNATEAEVEALVGAGASVRVQGELSCGGESVTFDWAFDRATTYTCEPPALSIPRGGEDVTQLTIHGDHLFYDGLEDPDAALRGLAILEADSNGDGAVTLEELDQVAVAPLGYSVGRYSDVTTLRGFIAHLTQTLGHVDGEGHCEVEF